MEIEAAIEKLPPSEFNQLLSWLEEYQSAIHASSEVFTLLDQEEDSGDQWQDKACIAAAKNKFTFSRKLACLAGKNPLN